MKPLFLVLLLSLLFIAISCSSDNSNEQEPQVQASSSSENEQPPVSSSIPSIFSSSSTIVAGSSSSQSSSSIAASSSSLQSSSSVRSSSSVAVSSSSNQSSSSVAASASSSSGEVAACTPSGTTFNSVVYKSQGNMQMDIKLPSGQGPWPIIVSSYGSGFGAGTRMVESPFSGGPTRSGQKYATAAISYTAYSAGNPSYPKAVEDVLAAVRFLKANASTYCLDTNKVVAVGFSSGAYMTAMIAALSGASGHKFDVGDNLSVSSKVHAAVSYAAISDIPNLDNDKIGLSGELSHCAGSPEAGFLGCDPCQSSCLAKAQEASPITYITSGNCTNLPPIIMTHGTNDNLLSWKQSEKMVNKIKEVCPSNTAIFNSVSGQGHQGGIGESNLSGLGVTGGYFGFLDKALGITN